MPRRAAIGLPKCVRLKGDTAVFRSSGSGGSFARRCQLRFAQPFGRERKRPGTVRDHQGAALGGCEVRKQNQGRFRQSELARGKDAPCPAMITPSSPTRTGFTKPNSAIEPTICATWASEHASVRCGHDDQAVERPSLDVG
jgi:hypothetical protein